MSRELGDLGSGMSLMLDLILNRPCLVSPFLCFVCSFGAVTSLSEDREIGKASDGRSTSCLKSSEDVASESSFLPIVCVCGSIFY